MVDINWGYLDSKGLLVDPATLVKQTNGDVLVMRLLEDLSAVYYECRILGDIDSKQMERLRKLRDKAFNALDTGLEFRSFPSVDRELIRLHRKRRGIPLDLPIGKE